jgi:hypothetical protein
MLLIMVSASPTTSYSDDLSWETYGSIPAVLAREYRHPENNETEQAIISMILIFLKKEII